MILGKLSYPWLRYRKKIIFSFIFDFFLYFLFFAHIIFDGTINSEYRIILFFNLFFWTSLSYIFGRYDFIKESILRRILIHIVLLTFCFAFYNISINYSSNFSEISLIRKFTITFTIYVSFCFLITNFLNQYFHKYIFKKNNFFFIGNEEKAKLVIKEFKNQSSNYIIKPINEIMKIDKKNVNGIIVDNPEEVVKEITKKLIFFQNIGIEVITTLNWCEMYLQRIPSFAITNSDIIKGLFKTEFQSIEMRIKRLGDILLALILLIITFPIILTSMILIFLDDRGPIFYTQKRVGKNEKIFSIIKLRSMRVDAERKGPQWAKEKDLRITKIGTLLRKLRFDELPQLISVIKGEMSLIGPRPERPSIDKELKKSIPHYSLRYSIRPGLSGWAQVNYPYGASIKDSKNKLSYDLFYIKNRSFILDILILIKTIKLILNAKGSTPKN
ncbi:exopolysaccharide biosynthesis polyprenyl glycosylphosphotransferase [Prochlorococcus marinus XMU1406]|uniref:exopolysaccharide biosynthesis polyprenyl glycosylphosphotransferase n=1 Tax=Prochlorococcus marinus TaxID=1219 RepID=UPI001ADC315F|nr:exopolysaccharide biosynthesis polyprenyl glycosylphosphotransferase [Prochlorococcus marinus]MBO8206822.1 exopolysaccharide biosynthesis polyprenyl glycosylphosphotransferase [Prochlorococcus marinus XMU1406]MCR8542641.1 exopolysaccharide biosynthesis polyprenyl glycosylphosphotransferase [Prochlorococcus marinus XMU1427]